MIGFDEDILDHFLNIARGTRNNVILMEGRELFVVVEGVASLPDILDHKILKAGQEGQMWSPVGQ